MTGREFSEVDIDLLADYVGGALDGTPDEATVARLVAGEPAWAEAYAELSGSMSSIQSELAAWGATAEPMPADVTERITTALEQQRPHLAPVGVPNADGPRRRVPRARRWWPAWGTPVAIAAGVAVVAGLGISQLGTVSSQNDEGSTTSAGAPQSRDDAAAGGSLAAPAVAASGRDYRSAALATAQAPVSQPFSASQEDLGAERAQVTTAASLARLTDTAALGECLAAITREHPQGVTTVEVVDYASVDGSPALVVFFTDGSGARWAWASGPGCGLPAWGADTRGSAKIG